MAVGRSPRPRRGWGSLVGLALVAMSIWVGVDPLALIAVPFALVVLALPPRKPWMAAVAVVALVFVLRGLPHESIWLLDRGWALVLGAWFVLAIVMLPRAPFMSRALSATAAAAITAAGLMALQRGGLPGAGGGVRDHLR